jgi:lipopolysaccharide transport system permease protein
VAELATISQSAPADASAGSAWSLGGESRLYWPGLWLGLAVTSFFLWLGLRQFRKMEKSFADLI